MLKIKAQYQKISSQFQIEMLLNTILAVVIVFIVLTVSYGLILPISVSQYQQVQLLSQQASYPQTQQMAENLLSQERIKTADFFRLMYAHHFESANVYEYPAMSLEDENKIE